MDEFDAPFKLGLALNGTAESAMQSLVDLQYVLSESPGSKCRYPSYWADLRFPVVRTTGKQQPSEPHPATITPSRDRGRLDTSSGRKMAEVFLSAARRIKAYRITAIVGSNFLIPVCNRGLPDGKIALPERPRGRLYRYSNHVKNLLSRELRRC